MYRKTRFLLASKVSEAKDINGAVAVYNKTLKGNVRILEPNI